MGKPHGFQAELTWLLKNNKSHPSNVGGEQFHYGKSRGQGEAVVEVKCRKSLGLRLGRVRMDTCIVSLSWSLEMPGLCFCCCDLVASHVGRSHLCWRMAILLSSCT